MRILGEHRMADGVAPVGEMVEHLDRLVRIRARGRHRGLRPADLARADRLQRARHLGDVPNAPDVEPHFPKRGHLTLLPGGHCRRQMAALSPASLSGEIFPSRSIVSEQRA